MTNPFKKKLYRYKQSNQPINEIIGSPRGCPKIMFTRLNIMIGTVKNHVGFAENKVTILSAFIGSEETSFMESPLFESPKKYKTALQTG